MGIDEAERWGKLIATQGLAVVIVIVVGALGVIAGRVLYREVIKPVTLAYIEFLRGITKAATDQKDATREIGAHLKAINAKIPSVCQYKPTLEKRPEQEH